MSRVLFLCDIALQNPTRGTPIHVARLLEELRAHHTLTVCAASVPDSLKDSFVRYPRGGGFEKLRALLKIVDEHKPELIFTIGQTGLLGPVLLKFLRGVRIVVELQGVEYIEKYAMGHISWLGAFLWQCKSLLLLPLYDSVIAFTRRTAGLYPFIQNVCIIFPGIDVHTLPHADVATPIPPLIAGYAGNTDPYQGLPDLISAVAIARERGLDARLHLVLTGNDGKVREWVQEHNLEAVTTIVRNVSHQDALKELLHVSTIVIARPNVPEAVYGFPSKLPEALALGVPVIATEVGAVPELLPEFAEHAIVIPPSDISTHLADAFERVARMDIEERKRWSEAARAYAERFSWERATTVANDAFARALR